MLLNGLESVIGNVGSINFYYLHNLSLFFFCFVFLQEVVHTFLITTMPFLDVNNSILFLFVNFTITVKIPSR